MPICDRCGREIPEGGNIQSPHTVRAQDLEEGMKTNGNYRKPKGKRPLPPKGTMEKVELSESNQKYGVNTAPSRKRPKTPKPCGQ